MCHLRVVLFVKGAGGPASSYKPTRDETQWWNRRDALVRCVASFLLGPRPPPPLGGGGDPTKNMERELILLYDEDWSRMHMTYTANASSKAKDATTPFLLVPTEQNVITLWKKAATCPGELVELDGLSCRLISSAPSSGPSTTHNPISGLDSKRSVLEYLQKTCSLEFLRREGLNSSTDVILRKTNKKTLMQIWTRWTKQQPEQSSCQEKDSKTSTKANSSNLLESTLQSLLQSNSNNVKHVIAATLHEASEDELPCWGQDFPLLDDEMEITTRVVLFLGGVRDMSREEHQCLQRVCTSSLVPCLALRLGPVPEFTSKILSVVAFHQSQNVLGPAMHQLALQQEKKKNKGATKKRSLESTVLTSEDSHNHSSSSNLHFICHVPVPSTSVSLDLEKRNRSLWSMIRCTVVTLWRSRLAGQSAKSSTHNNSNDSLQPVINNQLTLVFADGIHITLYQDELVASLAEQHQAAPSEYQILRALINKLQEQPPPQQAKPNTTKTTQHNGRENIPTLLQSIVRKEQGSQPMCLLDLGLEKGGVDFAELFYATSSEATSDASASSPSVIVLLPMKDDDKGNEKQMKAFRKEVSKLNIPTIVCSRSGLSSCQDQEASVITLLQHSCYQNRLFQTLQQCVLKTATKKRKEKHHR